MGIPAAFLVVSSHYHHSVISALRYARLEMTGCCQPPVFSLDADSCQPPELLNPGSVASDCFLLFVAVVMLFYHLPALINSVNRQLFSELCSGNTVVANRPLFATV